MTAGTNLTNKVSSNTQSCVLDFLNPKELGQMTSVNKRWSVEATKPLTIARVLCHSEEGFGRVAKVCDFLTTETLKLCESLTQKTLYVAQGTVRRDGTAGVAYAQEEVLLKSGYDLNNPDDITFYSFTCTAVFNFITAKECPNKNPVICPKMLPVNVTYDVPRIHLSFADRHVIIKLPSIMKKEKACHLGGYSTPGAWDEDPTLEDLKSIFYLGHLKKLEAPKSAENDKKANAKS